VTTYGTLGDLSDAQLQTALDRFGLGRLVRAEAFTEGLFGKNVGLVTDTGRWVLRGQPWAADTPDEQFRRERFWASRIRAACDVPVPWPFHIEPDPTLFGWPYQLTPWMPGEQERNAVGAVAVARAAADLRRVTFRAFGDWSPVTDDIEPFAGTAEEWLRARTQRWIDRCAAGSRALTDADLAFVDALYPTDLDGVVPTYVHHDLKVGNCVCIDGAVSGLFDLGEGLIGDPIEDLARTCWDLARDDPALVGTFVRYEDAAGVRVPLDRLWAYVVFDLLVIWEFATRPEQSWLDDHPTFEAWVTAFGADVAGALEISRR